MQTQIHFMQIKFSHLHNIFSICVHFWAYSSTCVGARLFHDYSECFEFKPESCANYKYRGSFRRKAFSQALLSSLIFILPSRAFTRTLAGALSNSSVFWEFVFRNIELERSTLKNDGAIAIDRQRDMIRLFWRMYRSTIRLWGDTLQ